MKQAIIPRLHDPSQPRIRPVGWATLGLAWWFSRLLLVATVSVSAPMSRLSADNWPAWRGPMLNGICQEDQLPIHWSDSKNIAWKAPLPGTAGSTPVIWGEQIFLTSASSQDNSQGDLLLLAFSTSGQPLWRDVLDSGNRALRGDEGNLASPSPSTDGKHVWALAGTGKLACYDTGGKREWMVDLGLRYGKLQINFGLASTPILHKGRLYLQLIHGDGDPATREARVVCLDAATGDQVWVQPRASDAADECEQAYATPTLYHDSRQWLLLTHGADYLLAHALSDGRELWRCGGINSPGNYHHTLRLVASPVANEQMIVVPTAKNGPVLAIRPAPPSSDQQGSDSGPSNSHELLWTCPNSTPDIPSPLIKDGLVYLCRENGNLICLNAQTGHIVYQHRTVRDRHRASPVWADGKIYLTSRGGIITVIQAGVDFKILAQNDMGEEMTSSPAIADGTIYLRTFNSLIAVRNENEGGGGERSE
jgi:outer membrane protein assembly factor BamB